MRAEALLARLVLWRTPVRNRCVARRTESPASGGADAARSRVVDRAVATSPRCRCALNYARVRASEKVTLWICGVMGVLTLAVGGFMAVSGVRLGGRLMLVGLAFVGAAAYFGWHRGTMIDARTHPILVLLRDRASDIVWVRRMRFLQGPSVDHVSFHLESGRSGGTLTLPPRDADELMAALQTGLPHATFGHGSEVARQYAQNPRSLRRPTA